jgi:hypothetical protein
VENRQGKLNVLSGLSIPPDFDRRVSWHTRGPAAIASVAGKSIAEIGAPPRTEGAMPVDAVHQSMERLGFNVVERTAVWPAFGLVMIVWDGPWEMSTLTAHWIAVSNIGRFGEVYDHHSPDNLLSLDFWRSGFANHIALHNVAGATGGWTLRTGLELVRADAPKEK